MESIYSIRPDGSEVMSEGFTKLLQELNQAVAESGAKLEGNLFYFHHEIDYVGRLPDPRRAHKRRNYYRAIRHKRSMLEVGFNAGHSALLALSSNPNLFYYGVDICQNPYTKKCSEILERAFPKRIKMHEGDSREVLPYLATHNTDIKFDIFHVDGGHGAHTCRTDISNCLRLAERQEGAHLLLDDTGVTFIHDIFCEFVSLGFLQTESFGLMHEGRESLAARIIKR